MIRRHFLAFALALTALTTGCGGVEADQSTPPTAPGQEARAPDESSDSQHRALYTCEQIAGTPCPLGEDSSCVYSDGTMGLCWCAYNRRWACWRESL